MGAMACADTQSISVLTGRPAATIRSWANRGLLTRRGSDPRGRTLYDIDEALELAMRLTVETPVTMCNTDHAVPEVCPEVSHG